MLGYTTFIALLECIWPMIHTLDTLVSIFPWSLVRILCSNSHGTLIVRFSYDGVDLQVTEHRPGKVPAGPNPGPSSKSWHMHVQLRRSLHFLYAEDNHIFRWTEQGSVLQPSRFLFVVVGAGGCCQLPEQFALQQHGWKMGHVIESLEAENKTWHFTCRAQAESTSLILIPLSLVPALLFQRVLRKHSIKIARKSPEGPERNNNMSIIRAS